MRRIRDILLDPILAYWYPVPVLHRTKNSYVTVFNKIPYQLICRGFFLSVTINLILLFIIFPYMHVDSLSFVQVGTGDFWGSYFAFILPGLRSLGQVHLLCVLPNKFSLY